MAPLNEENDDEDDSTLFDIKYRFEFSTPELEFIWHQTDYIFNFVLFKYDYTVPSTICKAVSVYAV